MRLGDWGVIIGDERIEADAVIAADGIHSLARKHVIGIQQHPRTSGFAVYRTCFPLDLLVNDPLTKPLTETKEDVSRIWLDTDVHAIMFVTDFQVRFLTIRFTQDTSETDCEMVASNPEFLKMPQPLWLFDFDAEKYTYDRFDKVVDSVKNGTSFVSKNIIEDHVHEDWTVEMMMTLEKEQAKEHFYRVANK
ncbi:hypothetical protein FGADI_8330 [Fusarium gaditjirri]|uniref:FAD-binding domain-containing protein n=1 Tax=Fusarium gaditjirri TaxID=282569 RepID=A0A8H4T2L2_9HYPO|nr:hypothetical protein FGADI_8330 [Fusarium gaditjirri]